MSSLRTDEDSAAVRKARFGALPERVAFEDLVEERPPLPAKAVDGYDPDGLAVRFACPAADLGL
ncbi:hypothetical protein AB0442_18630 [Kitasatospora sp. NPDC085895]|uniref:hypothetical protein n=1 Tax=Kitasatospora sp. NPDC085895 TaxID=3155057 RepID=UPI00344B9FEF